MRAGNAAHSIREAAQGNGACVGDAIYRGADYGAETLQEGADIGAVNMSAICICFSGPHTRPDRLLSRQTVNGVYYFANTGNDPKMPDGQKDTNRRRFVLGSDTPQ